MGSGVLPFSGQTPSLSGPWRPQLAGGDHSTRPQHRRRSPGAHWGLALGSRSGRPLEAAAGSSRPPIPAPPTCWALEGGGPHVLLSLPLGPFRGLPLRTPFTEGTTKTWRVKPSARPGASGDRGPARLQPVSERAAVTSRACQRLPPRVSQRGFPQAPGEARASPETAPWPGVLCCHCH